MHHTANQLGEITVEIRAVNDGWDEKKTQQNQPENKQCCVIITALKGTQYSIQLFGETLYFPGKSKGTLPLAAPIFCHWSWEQSSDPNICLQHPVYSESYICSVNLANNFSNSYFARKLRFNGIRNTLVSMKFPFTVQDLFKIQKEKEAFTRGKPEAMEWTIGKWVSSVCSKRARVKTYTWNLSHLREVRRSLALVEGYFPLNLFKGLLFHFNEEQSLDILFSSFFKTEHYFPDRANINSLFQFSATFPVWLK